MEKQGLDELVRTAGIVAYDDSGTPVEYGTHIHAAARYSVQMNLLMAGRCRDERQTC
ncbi:hypothetical protein [Nonomuraea polychroma]|uniref:hypothetical protein n=1 Tax=Nonomuraea polychroma TaxID=46176 RepID=UPI0013E31A80|nr:hypothetical protein [Nonomuraea polychroma]